MAGASMSRVLPQIWLLAAGLHGLVAVAAAAYGRHAPLDPGAREMFAIGSQFQLAHALALLGVAWLAGAEAAARHWPAHLAGAAFTLGAMLFSGSLYAFALRGAVPVEGAAPVGGWFLMLGWLAIALTAVRNLLSARWER
jgi:uncharacterized membrane protein YgdD (TMEM256/DUF423 family)